MTDLIGLAGYAGAGKDTVAGFLAEAGYQAVAFADPVYEGVLALDPLVPVNGQVWRVSDIVDEFGWDRAKRSYPEVRRLLQRYGTEAGRGVHGENCWVDAAMRRVGQLGDRVVLTDVRFANEADAVLAAGGQVWRVNRHGVGAANEHVSEHALDGWHGFSWHVWNNGSLAELRACVLATLGVAA